MDSGCAAGSGAGAGPVDHADADARVLGFFQWQEQRRRLVRDEQGWASMSVASTGKSLAGRCWASTCPAGSMTRSRPKTSLFRPPVLLPRGNSSRLLPFLQVPSSNPMEAEYYQAGASLLWSRTTRRRKREDDEEIEPPPQRVDPRNSEARHAEDKLKAVAHELGHEVRVFSSEKFAAVPSKLPGADQEEDDEFYELQPADYFNLISNRMTEQSKMLKTRKMREAELAAQRAKRTKVVMRVRFPDGYILEADFLPSERIHSLVDLLMKVIARPDLPFYLYTVPPKKRIVDTSQDFYTVGFVPGANVYFSYDLVEGSTLNMDNVKSGSYLHEEIRSLNGLSLLAKPASQCDDSKMNSTAHQLNESQSDSVSSTNKKPNRPKWFKR